MSIGILNRRGDTIVEVLLATTVLSAILFTSWTVVNRASQISSAAQQRVYMVDQLKEQAEIIQSYYGANGGKVAASQGIFGAGVLTPVGTVSQVQDNPCDASRNSSTQETNGVNPQRGFYFDGNAELKGGMKVIDRYGNARVWVQRVAVSAGGVSQYSDFYIQACWVSSGGGAQKEDNSKIIVRLNT